nr:MAG TPA: hypothetical protein [Caudoviricetes sp.]
MVEKIISITSSAKGFSPFVIDLLFFVMCGIILVIICVTFYLSYFSG